MNTGEYNPFPTATTSPITRSDTSFVVPDFNPTVAVPGKHTAVVEFGAVVASGGVPIVGLGSTVAAGDISGATGVDSAEGSGVEITGDGKVLGMGEGLTDMPGGIAEAGDVDADGSSTGRGVKFTGWFCLTNTGIGSE